MCNVGLIIFYPTISFKDTKSFSTLLPPMHNQELIFMQS